MHDAISTAGGNACEPLAQYFRWEHASVRAQVLHERPVDSAWNVAGNGIDRLDVAAETFRAARVHDMPVHLAVHRIQHLVAVHRLDERGTPLETDRRVLRNRIACFKPRGAPRLPAAIKHRDCLVAKPAQQPPQSCRHRTAVRVIRDNLRVPADSPVAERLRKRARIRQRMSPGALRHRTGKVALKMCVGCARNVRVAPGGLACIRIGEIETAIHDAPVIVAKVKLKVVRADER